MASIGVDMHSHLVPGIDDGSKSAEESLKILERMYELGFRKIITTPHTMWGGYDNTPETISNGAQALNQFLEDQNFPLKVEASSEYYSDGHFDELIKTKNLLPFANNHILFELSYMFKPSNLAVTIFDLSVDGYKPILAHPERYNYLFDKDLKEYNKIKDSGAYLQLNLFSLVDAYGPAAKQIAHKLIDADLIDFVGTDIHNTAQLSYLDALLSDPYMDKLLQKDKLLNKTLL
ncbi:MAG: capsular biosynthesis protein [Chitinophagales bacterium]|nr:capsular biosynthesis protein [Chitinophagales bacterium]